MVLIAGVGVAGREAAKTIRLLAGDRVCLTLLAPPQRGVGDPDLPELCRELDAQSVVDEIVSIDAGNQRAWVRRGAPVPFDVAVVAVGAKRRVWMRDAVTIGEPRWNQQVARLLQSMPGDGTRDLAFVVPRGEAWPVPIYDLAFRAARYRAAHGAAAGIQVITPEADPLAIFGGQASWAVENALRHHDIGLHIGCSAVSRLGRDLSVVPHEAGPIPADEVVTLPRLVGPAVRGLPSDARGFVPVDSYGRVTGLPGVYAVGAATSVVPSQRDVAVQLAETVGSHIAARYHPMLRPRAFRPSLRAVLRTGSEPLYLRAEHGARRPLVSEAARHPLWAAEQADGEHAVHLSS